MCEQVVSKLCVSKLFVCVCVERLRRRKTSVVIHRIIYYIIVYIPKSRGPPGSRGGRWPRKTPPGTRVNVPACSGPGRQPLKWGP